MTDPMTPERPFLERFAAVVLFLAAAAVYVWSAGPGLTAYRDSGEMVTVLSTLGVAHPPGYPLYTLVGSVFTKLVPGCIALRANYFSALSGAGVIMCLFLFLRRWCGWLPSLVGAGLLAFYRPFWELAAVSEMYTFGMLWVVLTLDAAFGRKNAALTGLLFGMGLGVRMDTLILAPIFLWPFIRDRRALIGAVGFAFFGMTIFAYLAIRSAADPFIDWGDPETLGALFRSMSRKSYGGSLDLLSQSYTTGTNFIVSLSLFVSSLWRYFGPAAALFGLAGLGIGAVKRPFPGVPVLLGFLLSGPLFLFMANMPPNPHALAILEASFILPALFCCIAAAFALDWLGRFRFGVWVAVAALALLARNPVSASPEAVKRNAWALRDYSEALFRSAPRSAIVAIREDVQLFAAWQAQLVEHRRPDLSVIAAGLSSSDWYWQMMSRWPTAAVPEVDLKLPRGFGGLARGTRPVLAAYETEVPPESALVFSSSGFLRRLTPETPPPVDGRLLLAVFLSRDNTVKFPDDFFTRDLKTDEANAFHSQAVDSLRISTTTAEFMMRRSEALDPDLMQPLMDRGYLALMAGHLPEGLDLYTRAAEGIEGLLRRADYYRSLPDVVSSLKRDLSTALDQQGVALERLGHLDDARAKYRASIGAFPTAMAYYNLGASYWNRDWAQAAENFERSVSMDPSNQQCRHYLEMARKALGK